jgi:hypothetical protein
LTVITVCEKLSQARSLYVPQDREADVGLAISSLIVAAEQGEGPAGEVLFAALYSELHRLAKRELVRYGFPVSLSSTTLLHEAYLDMAAREFFVSRPGAVHGVCGASDAWTHHRPMHGNATPRNAAAFSRLLRSPLGHASIQTTEKYLGGEQDIENAVNDRIFARVKTFQSNSDEQSDRR